MILSRALAAVVAGAGLLLQAATAHSIQRDPLSYITRIDDAVIQTPSHRVNAHSSFELTFLLHDRRQKIRLQLEPNHDILSEDASVQYVGADGVVHTIEPIDRSEHRIFKGTAFIRHEGHTEWTNAGWARINVHQDGEKPIFEGALRIDGNHHHIQTSTNYRQTTIAGDPEVEPATEEYMIVWRDSDIGLETYGGRDELKRDLGSVAGCTSDELLYNRDDSNIVYRSLEDVAPEQTSTWAISPRVLFGRQIDGTAGGNGAGVNLANTIGSTAGCPTTRKVALVGIATDCTYTAQFNSTAAVRANIIQQINSASQLYESTFNISLGIQNLTISDPECPAQASSSAPWNVACSTSTTITGRLNLFSAWRGQFNDSNAYWTLLSTCGTGAAVGLAWLGQVCQEGAQTANNETIAAANVVVRTSTEWQVIAHETGHTFGAVHDCTPTTCSDGTVTKQQCCPLSTSSCDAKSQFIMNPSTGSGISTFSPCSVGNICSFLGRNSAKTNCLANNKDVTTITGSQCGNGIVESGEDCDCGGVSGCGDNKCCDPKTCKFTSGSVCDPSNEDCCTQTCAFASAGTVCRPSTGSCDPQEVCPGNLGTCPADKSADDGTSCGASGAGLTCASGQCTSRDLQCKTLMGSLTAGNDTTSCSQQGCLLQCASPEFSSCLQMPQYFLDGTPCQGGGKCSNGQCQGASVGNEVLAWIQDNKAIFIPVVAVVGTMLLLGLACCCWTSVSRRRRRRRRGGVPKLPTGPPQGWNNPTMTGAYGAPAIPPAAARGGGGNGQRGQLYYPGNGQSPRPPPPPNGQQWGPVRSTSFRYA
ncbi:Metallo-peptidase family M12-domain-containing protein [Diplogelasinospora grovesii]|uniref:Disintegrin and metalloproteinase domain-containing protein B n=1 Tax=Diplogelasinospora grovesii TaxID=303347 RepID=A0AAN6SAS9_9PEZI|nr:Metallo-peptidase family M12-domain-containing protein [Diplogelasinospora grovesii]